MARLTRKQELELDAALGRSGGAPRGNPAAEGAAAVKRDEEERAKLPEVRYDSMIVWEPLGTLTLRFLFSDPKRYQLAGAALLRIAADLNEALYAAGINAEFHRAVNIDMRRTAGAGELFLRCELNTAGELSVVRAYCSAASALLALRCSPSFGGAR